MRSPHPSASRAARLAGCAALAAVLTLPAASAATAATATPAHPAVTAHQAALARRIADRHLHTRPQRVRPHNQTSPNWAGYVAGNATFHTVTAQWTEPAVSCDQGGMVVFWIGLDGYGSQTVEQTGTGVDCSTGAPDYFAWWETYPENAIQPYNDVVQPGDAMTSTVTDSGGGRYDLLLTDTTQGWTEDNPVAGPGGAADASAEVVAEAPTGGGGQVALPDFGSVRFTGSTIDNSSLQAAGAQPIDMAPNGQVDAVTDTADDNGDFSVTWQGSS